MSAAAALAAPVAGVRPGGGLRYNQPRRRSAQTVWVPEQIYRGAHYCDEAVAVYIKVAALDARRSWLYARPDEPPCTASVAELAGMLGMSVSAVERGLRPLNGPAPDGGMSWISTRRRTHRGGLGRTAERRARLTTTAEPGIEVPVRLADALPVRRLRAWLHLARATDLRIPVTAAELAGELRHHTGKRAGETLSARAGLRLMDDLEAGGWIALDRRAGYQGRHLVTVNRTPLRTAGAPAAASPGPVIHDGSGPADHDGSLTSKEDTSSPTDGVSRGVDSGSRRRRLRVVEGAQPVDNPVPGTFRAAGGRGTGGGYSRSPQDGSGATLTAREWELLGPVRHLLSGATGWETARIQTEIRRQLAAGAGARRITQRLQRRYAALHIGEIHDPVRWVLGVGLPRVPRTWRGCGLDVCEDGTIWHTGHECGVCADIAAAARAAAARDSAGDTPPEPELDPAPEPAAPEPERMFVAVPPDAAAGPEPPPLTRRERLALREHATPAEVRAAIRQWGRSAAGHLYGLTRTAAAITAMENGEHDAE
ncbi:hypothetical protein [Streptomyces sp. CAU 1734]|uniref:hypothetical protein n=1 Tax=Streptomyces sp. CAU 1734 TaxID=3140360 RepID=UPI0032612B6D